MTKKVDFYMDALQRHLIDSNNPTKISKWDKAWKELLIGETGKSIDSLSELNISLDAQSKFIDRLANKYANQFTMDLVHYIQAQFKCDKLINLNHAIRFGGVTNLKNLFETSKRQSVLGITLFQVSQEGEDVENVNRPEFP